MRILILLMLLCPAAGYTESAIIATAANFRHTLGTLQADFERRTAHTLVLVSGSTGKLYAQIRNGAPFDVFFAADQLRPDLLENDALAVAGSRITYALGRLAVVAYDSALLGDDAGRALQQGATGTLAIANPAVAPYGTAAMEVLQKLAIDDGHFKTIVFGENVAQVMAMVSTGNADLGLVSRSLAMTSSLAGEHAFRVVPRELHEPIRQDAVLLVHGERNAAAVAFIEYVESPDGQRIIEAAGYGLE